MGSPVEAAMAPPAMAAMAQDIDPGLKLAAITDAERQKFGIPAGVNGALITDVLIDSDPAEQGVRPGDIIVNVNGMPIVTPQAFGAVVQKAHDQGQSYVPFLVSGKGGLRWASYYTGSKKQN
jgi:serine protease Do